MACRETADLFRSVLLLPGTFTLLPGTINQSRILPCGKRPHFYLVYTSLPWIHFCLVRSEVYHLYLLSWPFVKGARQSFSHRSHSFSVVSFHFSPDTHFPYGWGFDCCHADAINRHCIALDKKYTHMNDMYTLYQKEGQDLKTSTVFQHLFWLLGALAFDAHPGQRGQHLLLPSKGDDFLGVSCTNHRVPRLL